MNGHLDNGWLPEEATKYPRIADTRHLRSVWSEVAKSIFARTKDEDRAIRAANAAVVAERRRGNNNHPARR